MSAVLIPAQLVPVARTDSDWAFDISLVGENWTGSGVSVSFARTKAPGYGFTATVGSGVAAPTSGLSCAIRILASTWANVPPGVYAVQVTRTASGVADDAAVFMLRVVAGVSVIGSGVAPGPIGDGVISGAVILDRTGPVQIVRGGAGPVGAAGVSAALFEHVQSSPLAEWILNHNLGHRPSVTVFSPGGVEVCASVIHQSVNQLRIYFSAPQTGSAHCV